LNALNQTYCGHCGSPLGLKEFIAGSVGVEVAKVIRDRDILETESAIKVFERAWGWVKIVGGIAAVLLAIVGGGIFWQVSDWRSGVEKAKESVADSASTASKQISATSTESISEIKRTSKNATEASQSAAQNASQLSGELQATASHTKSELANEALAVKKEVASSREELAAVEQLQPEFKTMRNQLSNATEAIAAQQKVLSSSEEFAKQIFSSHATETFYFDQFTKTRSVVLPPAEGKGITVVYLLLPSSPISGTVQLQWNIFLQLPDTYNIIHNLIIFRWGDPADNLKQKPMSVSYFPDVSDKEIIKSLSVHDGRVFADDQPLPKIGQLDPEFNGNKWIPILTPKPQR
jgi:hypothetical protein